MNSTTTPRNRLAHESSLYLRQHAGNPVDWYPWGPEALQRAKELDRPIFLSIGYSACHWCHVMEHECFEDAAIAGYLNEHFVSIKVDREERPDLDSIYMTALQAMTREGGGWPLSVWLTPELKPFYAGTYFPPDDRYAPQRPSFPQLLRAIVDAWQNRRPELEKQSSAVVEFLRGASDLEPAVGDLSPELLQGALTALRRAFDPVHGGFGQAPKFPHALELRLLLRIWKRFGADDALHMTRLTLDKMAMGGMYDQVGGGFHRYSTDARWLVPHFEKMLYDNALLTSAYVEAWRATGEAAYREVAEETLAYVLREMTSPAGAFYSTQDADSEGEEGKFYVWTLAEIESVLGKDEAELFNYVFGITEDGNFEGRNIPHRVKTWDQLARMLNLSVEDLRRRVAESSGKLYQVRSRRVWPGRDEKILTAWNALMIAAFAQAGAAFDEPRYTGAAQRAADFLLKQMRSPDGRLFRTAAVGSPPKLNAYLEDYAFLIDALMELYQADFAPRWLRAALELADVMVNQFWDAAGGGFFYTGTDHEQLITRSKDTHDGSTPSGNAMAAAALLKLGHVTGRKEFIEKGRRTLQVFRGTMADSPMSMGQMLCALDFFLGPDRETVVVGRRGDPETERVLKVVRGGFRPNELVVFHDPGSGAASVELLPTLEGRAMQADRVTTFLCENQTCGLPLVGVEAVEREIGKE
jgi:uncharacterized protein YyaL (SSP411 family)